MKQANKDYDRPEDAWRVTSPRKGLSVCLIHDVCFKTNSECNKCYPPHTPPLPVETQKKKKSGVHDVARHDGGLSKKEIKAYKFYSNGKSFSWIAKHFKVGKSTAFRWVNKYKAFIKCHKGAIKRNDKLLAKNGTIMGGHLKRLHNDVVSFLIEPVEFFMEDTVKLKYAEYKLMKDKDFGFKPNEVGWHIQIWKSKVTVRFKKDIESKTVKTCKKLADERIKHFLKYFGVKGVRFLNDRYEQSSRHYAILGTKLAEKVVKEKKKVIVFDRGDGKKRFEVDFSHKKPESENTHAKKSDVDAVNTSDYFDDMLHNPGSYDLPSVTLEKINGLFRGIQEQNKLVNEVGNRYGENINLHLKTEQITANTLGKMGKVLSDMNETLKDIRESLRKS